MKDVIAIYNSKNSFFVNKTNLMATIEPLIRNIDIAIVIPACNEYPTLFDTLNSLFHSYGKVGEGEKTLCALGIVVVVNNKKSSSIDVKENNRQLLKSLSNFHLPNCPIITIDLTREGFELPEKQGVGYCRKYGMDFALLCNATVIACMDADTLVSENYGKELFAFYERCKRARLEKKAVPVGAVTQFDHQQNADKKAEEISREYECYMRSHSKKLKKAGTPFWLWALGPTIVCSSYGYAGCAGMNKRVAGEDFYFLQSLVKLHIQQQNNGFSQDDIKKALDFPILNCTVCPQSRYSDRVLFGTGKKIQDVKQGKDIIQCYDDALYESLEYFFRLFVEAKGTPGLFFEKIKKNLPLIWQFLQSENFFAIWEELYRQNNKSDKRIYSSFHSWFDGLKILRLIHALERKNKN